MQVVRTKAASAFGKGLHRRRGEGADGHGVGFIARVHYPDQLGPVGTIVEHAFIAHDPQATLFERQHGVGEAVEGRRVVPLGDDLDVAQVADVEHQRAAVDVADISAIGLIGKDVGVVGAKAHVEGRRQARWRRGAVTHARAGVPPAAHLDRLGEVRHVQDAVELIVQRVGGHKVARTGRHVDGFAIDKPHCVHTA